MKILHTGNLCNNSYKLAKFQRRFGLDADLLLAGSQIGTGDDPAWEDPEYKNRYPTWIKIYGSKSYQNTLSKLSNTMSHIKLGRKIVGQKNYDIIHAQCTEPIFAQFFGCKILISHCLGSDLREVATSNSILGFLLRNAYKKSKIIYFNNIDHSYYLDQLGLKAQFLPNPLDLDRIYPKKVTNFLGKLRFTILHPTNLDWTYIGNERSSTKGNDRLIRAFARFVKVNPNSLLIMLKSGVDYKATKALVSDLNISENIKFLDRMEKKDLIEMLNSVNLVADQFDVGAFGGVALEAMACGTPVLTYLKENLARQCYERLPPIYNCSSEKEIFEALLRAADDNLSMIGEESREWIENFHDWRIVVERVVERYNRVLSS